MELLVYCRCYRPWGASADEPARRELGVSVGERVPALGLGERLCGFVEVRLPAAVIDIGTEVELLVAKAFAAWGHPGGGRVLRFRNARGSVAMLLEPGFERARDLCRALGPVLPQARAMLEGAVRRTSATAVVPPGTAPEHIELVERPRPPATWLAGLGSRPHP